MPTSNPLEILKKGLEILQRKTDCKWKELTKKAKNGQLSETEETWLDIEDNIVDELRVLSILTDTGLKSPPSATVGGRPAFYLGAS